MKVEAQGFEPRVSITPIGVPSKEKQTYSIPQKNFEISPRATDGSQRDRTSIILDHQAVASTRAGTSAKC